MGGGSSFGAYVYSTETTAWSPALKTVRGPGPGTIDAGSCISYDSNFVNLGRTGEDDMCGDTAVQQVRTSSTVTVTEYENLQAFVASVAAACSQVEGVATQPDLHILAFRATAG